jgi:hypothetical protein
VIGCVTVFIAVNRLDSTTSTPATTRPFRTRSYLTRPLHHWLRRRVDSTSSSWACASSCLGPECLLECRPSMMLGMPTCLYYLQVSLRLQGSQRLQMSIQNVSEAVVARTHGCNTYNWTQRRFHQCTRQSVFEGMVNSRTSAIASLEALQHTTVHW